MANKHVADVETKKAIQSTPKSLFKMKKFLQVNPRTSTKNEGYKPARRSTTQIRTSQQPTAI
jgi:hypothetical protein